MRVLNISLKRNLTIAQVVMEFCLKQVPLASNGPSYSDIYPEPGGKMEKAMATHSSTLAWKIPWVEEPGRLQHKSRTWLSDLTFTFHFHVLEKEMATHSSVLAWRIPGTGEPGGLPSMGSHRVEHDWSDLAAVAAAGGKKKLCLRLNLKGEVEHTQGQAQPKGLDQSSKIF